MSYRFLELLAAGFEPRTLEIPIYLLNYQTCPNQLRYQLFLYSV